MTVISLLPIFMVGLLGSVHCVGMCGGIVGALSMTSASRRPFPVPVSVPGSAGMAQVQGMQAQAHALDRASRVMAYNAGRIGSYMLAGAVAGGVSGGARFLAAFSTLQMAGYWLANLMLVALGLYLMNAWRGLAKVEAAGQIMWRRVQPLMKPLLPMDSPARALALGGLWGWVPCGMVYSVLLTALLTGSALSGAAVMLAFGLGTLPMLLAMGMAGARVHGWLGRPGVRIACGLVVLGFGLLGLARAADGLHGLPHGWLDALCLTPPAEAHR
jgi:uncharacterized protein